MLQKLSTILLAALLLASCGALTHDRTTAVYYADFTQYPDLWISPNACTTPHDVLGEFSIEVYPGLVSKRGQSADGVYTSSVNSLQIEKIGYNELLEMAVVEARARKADGISNLNITTRRTTEGTVINYNVEGVLIRRK